MWSWPCTKNHSADDLSENRTENMQKSTARVEEKWSREISMNKMEGNIKIGHLQTGYECVEWICLGHVA